MSLFPCCVIIYRFADVEITVRYSFLSRQLVILWCWLNWKLPLCGRILFPDIRNTVTFSLPTFTWLILTAVHGAAWCHLQALSRVKPCTYMIRNERGAMYASLFHSNTQRGDRKVSRLVTLMIILDGRHLFSCRGEKKQTLFSQRSALGGHIPHAHRVWTVMSWL